MSIADLVYAKPPSALTIVSCRLSLAAIYEVMDWGGIQPVSESP